VELTVEYAGQRTQFGVPIGSFQAIKHTCAAMHVDTTEAEALAELAAGAAGDGDEHSLLLADQAKALASETFSSVARRAIEVHGGVGFAWEHPVQLFYKRSLATSAWFGRPAELYAAVGARGLTRRARSRRLP
jgi:alkylation response protein AidB-like acyl-CoA dehydrogenase